MTNGQNTYAIADITKQYKTLKIDDYQRTYSWKQEQVDAFFRDVLDASDSNSTPHFFGTLILQKGQNSSDEAAIVDGQQRLTTVFILLSLLRDKISTLSIQEIPAQKGGLAPIRPKERIQNLILNKMEKGNYRFTGNRFIRKIFTESVLAEPEEQKAIPKSDKPSTLAFRKAVWRLSKILDESLQRFSSDEQVLDAINGLVETISDKFIVLKIETGSLTESLEIFLTLNNRGLPLDASDLVRGEIMSILGYNETDDEQIKIQEEIINEWNDITNEIDEPQTFLRHYLMSSDEARFGKKQIVEQVSKKFKDLSPEAKKKHARKFWDEMLDASSRYQRIISHSSFTAEGNYHLMLTEGLQKSHRILVLCLLEREEELPNLAEILRLIFALSFRWSASPKYPQELENTFHQLSIGFRGGMTEGELIEALRKLVENLVGVFPVFFRRDADTSFVTRCALHYANYQLSKGAVLPDIKSFHLEHIAPQSPTELWRNKLFSADETEYDRYEEFTGAAGNLTLLDPSFNVKIQNKPLEDKQAQYLKSVMLITRELAEFDDWSKEIIVARTKWLSEFFEDACSAAPMLGTPKKFVDWYKAQN